MPCIVLKCSEKESAIYALLENLQRSDLGIFEEARGISKLIRRYGLTQEEAANRLGKSQSTIANKLRLLRLTYEEQEWIVNAGLSERHARALLRIEDDALRHEALSKIISENLNTSQTDELVGILINSVPKTTKSKGTSKAVIKDLRIFLNTINKAIDTMRLAGIDAQSDKKTQTILLNTQFGFLKDIKSLMQKNCLIHFSEGAKASVPLIPISLSKPLAKSRTVMCDFLRCIVFIFWLHRKCFT